MTTNTNTVPMTHDFSFEEPTLTLIGHAADVVLGLPGGGFDGPYGMTEPDFEFELDGEL